MLMLLVQILLAQLKRGPESLALPHPHDMLLIALLMPLRLLFFLDVLLGSCLLLARVATS